MSKQLKSNTEIVDKRRGVFFFIVAIALLTVCLNCLVTLIFFSHARFTWAHLDGKYLVEKKIMLKIFY